MPACRYCNGTVSQDDYDAVPDGMEPFHKACMDEMLRRVDAGECTKCGDARAEDGDHWCAACNAARLPEYAGYPGEAGA